MHNQHWFSNVLLYHVSYNMVHNMLYRCYQYVNIYIHIYMSIYIYSNNVVIYNMFCTYLPWLLSVEFISPTTLQDLSSMSWLYVQLEDWPSGPSFGKCGLTCNGQTVTQLFREIQLWHQCATCHEIQSTILGNEVGNHSLLASISVSSMDLQRFQTPHWHSLFRDFWVDKPLLVE